MVQWLILHCPKWIRYRHASRRQPLPDSTGGGAQTTFVLVSALNERYEYFFYHYIPVADLSFNPILTNWKCVWKWGTSGQLSDASFLSFLPSILTYWLNSSWLLQTCWSLLAKCALCWCNNTLFYSCFSIIYPFFQTGSTGPCTHGSGSRLIEKYYLKKETKTLKPQPELHFLKVCGLLYCSQKKRPSVCLQLSRKNKFCFSGLKLQTVTLFSFLTHPSPITLFFYIFKIKLGNKQFT